MFKIIDTKAKDELTIENHHKRALSDMKFEDQTLKNVNTVKNLELSPIRPLHEVIDQST